MKKMLLASTSTIHGQKYLEYILEEVSLLFYKCKNILFIPFARPSGITHLQYTNLVKKTFGKINLHVQFKPSTVLISVDPPTPQAGNTATLTCKSDSSNPTASIVWRKTNSKDFIFHGINEEPVPGEFGGNCTTNRLEINVTAELDGSVYICEATNEELRESVHTATTLRVNCKTFTQ